MPELEIELDPLSWKENTLTLCYWTGQNKFTLVGDYIFIIER